MFFRRQRTKSRTNFFSEKKIIVEIFEIQSKTKITILIKNVFERKFSSNMTSIIEIQDFVIISQNIEMIDTFVKILNNRIIDPSKTKFEIINAKKRRIHLRHLLIQTKVKREIDFFVASVTEIETKRIRNNFEQQTALSLKKKLKFKISKIYFENIQKSFDKYIRKYDNEFGFKVIIY